MLEHITESRYSTVRVLHLWKYCLQAVGKLGPTMYMGEAALQGMEQSQANVVAQTNVDLLQLQRSDAVRLLGAPFLQLVSQSTVSTVKKVLLKRLPDIGGNYQMAVKI